MRIIPIIMLCSFMLMGCHPNNSNTIDPNEPNSYLNKTKATEATLGDPQTAGNLTYEILNVTQKNSLDGAYDSKEKVLKPKNGTFLILKVSIKNRSNQNIRLGLRTFSLILKNGKSYFPHLVADNWVQKSNENRHELIYKIIPPYGKRIGYLVFDVPNKPLDFYRFEGTDGTTSATSQKVQIDLTP